MPGSGTTEGETKVVAGPDAVAVFGIAVSEEGVVAGAVVATDEGVAAVEAAAVPAADDSDTTGGAESGDGDDQS
jgi:hypothetical protein